MAMTTSYKVVATAQDPELSLKLPSSILKDLVLRSNENGRSIEVEIAIRLARSLERDQQMLENDNLLALAAFETMESFAK
jgi:hypothetical protein